MKSTAAALLAIALAPLAACASASGDDELMASPTSPPMRSTGLDAAVDAAGRKTEGNVDAAPPRRDPVLPDAGTPPVDASAPPVSELPTPPVPDAAPPVDAAPPPPPPPPAGPTWRPLGRTARRAAVGCCSVTTTGTFDCTAATVGTELRLGADAQRKSSLGELSEYGWLQGVSAAFNGSTVTIAGRSSCGCDTVVTLLSEAYVCAY